MRLSRQSTPEFHDEFKQFVKKKLDVKRIRNGRNGDWIFN